MKVAKYGIRVLNSYIDLRNRRRKFREDKEWDLLFKGDSRFIWKLNNSLKIFNYRDSILSRYIYNGFEETEIFFLRKFLKKSDIFFDIGGNIGLFSMHAAEIVGETGKVHAFEPTPNTFLRLKQNVNLNDFGKIIICNNIGLSSKEDKLNFNITVDGYDGWNTFASSTDVPFQEQLEIPVNTLDNYAERYGLKPIDIALMKIDVEGWEVEVLHGAIETLKGLNAPALMIEFTEQNLFAAGTNCYILYDLVTSLGYQWYIYDSVRNLLVPERKKLHYAYNNLIAIKNIDLANRRLSF